MLRDCVSVTQAPPSRRLERQITGATRIACAPRTPSPDAPLYRVSAVDTIISSCEVKRGKGRRQSPPAQGPRQKYSHGAVEQQRQKELDGKVLIDRHRALGTELERKRGSKRESKNVTCLRETNRRREGRCAQEASAHTKRRSQKAHAHRPPGKGVGAKRVRRYARKRGEGTAREREDRAGQVQHRRVRSRERGDIKD